MATHPRDAQAYLRWRVLSLNHQAALRDLEAAAFHAQGLPDDVFQASRMARVRPDVARRVWGIWCESAELRGGLWMMPGQWADVDALRMRLGRAKKAARTRWGNIEPQPQNQLSNKINTLSPVLLISNDLGDAKSQPSVTPAGFTSVLLKINDLGDAKDSQPSNSPAVNTLSNDSLKTNDLGDANAQAPEQPLNSTETAPGFLEFLLKTNDLRDALALHKASPGNPPMGALSSGAGSFLPEVGKPSENGDLRGFPQAADDPQRARGKNINPELKPFGINTNPLDSERNKKSEDLLSTRAGAQAREAGQVEQVGQAVAGASQADASTATVDREGLPFVSDDQAADANWREQAPIFGALQVIFPAASENLLQRALLAAVQAQAEPKAVSLWPAWYAARFPASSASLFKFCDTIKALVSEMAGGVLQGSCGAKFIATAVGAKRWQDLTMQEVTELTAAGRWLDQTWGQGMTKQAEWKAKGWTGARFVEFWYGEKEQRMLPRCESVRKYFAEFVQWNEENPNESD